MGSVNFNVGFNDKVRDDLGFKAKDIEIPVKINENNYDIGQLTDSEAIYNSISNIFHWYKGERILNPEFGNPLLEYIYEPINERTSKNIAIAMKNAIELWEPRVELQLVEVTPNPDAQEYVISIRYSVPVLDLYNLDYNKTIYVGE